MPSSFRPVWGISSELPSDIAPGRLYICTDTREILLDTESGDRISLNSLTELPGVLPIESGGTGGTDRNSARYNLHVPAEVTFDNVSDFPFSFGILCAKGDLGNTVGQATADNYYWGVDSTATLWGGKQTNRATSPTWYKAMMMDGNQDFQRLWSGNLTGTNSATITTARKFTALILCGYPGNDDENLQYACVPSGSLTPNQFCSNQYWFTYSLATSGNNITIKILENPNGGSFRFCWGILRHTL